MNDRSPGDPLHGNSTILVVEDEQAILRLATLVLEREGYRVVPAGGVDEALSVAGGFDRAPALVITDIALPDGNGRSVADALRRRWSRLPVVFVSGFPEHGEDLPDGATFLAKPFTPADLLRMVRERLDRSA